MRARVPLVSLGLALAVAPPSTLEPPNASPPPWAARGRWTTSSSMKTMLEGKPLTAIAAFTEVPGARILVGSTHRDTIRQPADLKGRSVAVTGLGAYSHLILVHVLVSSGLQPGDVEAIPVGAEALAAALGNGRVDAMVAAGLLGAKLVEIGRAYVLLDLQSRAAAERLFGAPYLKGSLMTRPGVCAQFVDRALADER